jgi:hypothetical protein
MILPNGGARRRKRLGCRAANAAERKAPPSKRRPWTEPVAQVFSFSLSGRVWLRDSASAGRERGDPAGRGRPRSRSRCRSFRRTGGISTSAAVIRAPRRSSLSSTTEARHLHRLRRRLPGSTDVYGMPYVVVDGTQPKVSVGSVLRRSDGVDHSTNRAFRSIRLVGDRSHTGSGAALPAAWIRVSQDRHL